LEKYIEFGLPKAVLHSNTPHCAAKRERLLAERESEKTEFISDRHS